MITEFKCPKQQFNTQVLAQGSKFLAYIGQISDLESAKEFILELKQKHPFASHICYAYSYVENTGKSVKTKSSDDKEPAGTAGKPILECLKNNNLNNTIICVVRYFGGTLLGASNLLRTYVSAAQLAIDGAVLESKILSKKLCVAVAYNELSKTEAFLKQNSCKVLDTEFAEDIYLTVAIPSSFVGFEEKLKDMLGHDLEIENLEEDFV